MVLAAPTAEAWKKVRVLVGISEPGSEAADWPARHRTEVDAAIVRYFEARTTVELEGIGRDADVAISRVYDMADISRDPHYRARSMFLEWEDPIAGPVQGAGIAPKFGRTPGLVWRGAPWLGQDNRAILHDILGYAEPEIRVLESSGILGSCAPSGSMPPEVPFYRREGR